MFETLRAWFAGGRNLQENSHALAGQVWYLQEQLAELEITLANADWQRIEQNEREFSRAGLRTVSKLSRLAFLKNPLVNRAVTLQAIYVWGQGVTFTAEDEEAQPVIDAFLEDPKNRCELTSHQARTMKEQDLQCMGNLFFVFFTDTVTGRVIVRTIPFDEIEEIIFNPEDSKDPWFYRRRWTVAVTDVTTGARTNVQRRAYYRDWRHTGETAERVESIGGDPVIWDSPVYHVRVGCLSDMQFGVPETYQALDWVRAYKDILTAWVSREQALAQFAWKSITKGGPKGIAAAKAKMNTRSLEGSNSNVLDGNPPFQPGSTWVGSGSDLEPLKVAGASTTPETARPLLHMVCASFGMPETFFGNLNVGNHATAKSLDRPTELKFRDRRQLWSDIFSDIFTYVVDAAAVAPQSELAGSGVSRKVTTEFPQILEHDVKEQIGAIVSAATLDGKQLAGTMSQEDTARMLLTALEAQGIDEMIDRLPEIAAAAQQPQLAKAVAGVSEALRKFEEAWLGGVAA